ncbi:proclotting enzyme-like [Tribolium madens]|uniref:proclotting enzyme-like n=1 Tax=Tribolium madens TaxID=41895 RepID=UPI001CF724D8|nr:proclotting enzyme-like [Tribolium madens]
MGIIYQLFYWCLLIVVFGFSPFVAQQHQETSDAIVIEAKLERQPKRSDTQFILKETAYQYNPGLIPSNINTVPLATTGPCFTGKGVLGKCTSFRQCYPYFKVPVLDNFESWILGMYDTCSYYTAQGRQMFGVCCANPVKPATESNETFNNALTNSNTTINEAIPYYPQLTNWPPPIPTHPPDHTIPPLPTHPPSPGYPPLPTHPPSPGYPTLPPVTQKPPAWPPAITTKPPYKPTRPTTKPPATQAPAVSSCGAKNGYQDQERIVGGHNADVGEWPWIAALFNGGRQFCGGSLIDNIHILSAAHCVAHMSSWDVARLTVRLGDHNIKTNTEIRHIEKRVKRIVRHRGFDPRTLYNDIAILTLDSPVQFSQQIRPICLPTVGNDFAGHTGTVIGWGSLRESGPQPSVLQEVNIPIWSNRDCKLKYGPAAPGGIVDHMLCAGQAARDSCSGDSGGPLMVNSGKWTQVGIVSWGIGCGKGQYPGVYTRVEKFLPWINKNLK